MPSILVIEDVAALRDYFRRVLEKEGYEVLQAADGAAGVQAYRRAPADLVLCDLVLPTLGGLDVIRELLRLDPAVKVLAISGVGVRPDGNILEDALALGAVSTLAKPFGIDALLGAVRAALGG